MFGYNPYNAYPQYYSPAYARALAEERARARAEAQAEMALQRLRNKYLVPEYEEDERISDDDVYSLYHGYDRGYGFEQGLSPRERAYLYAKRRRMEEEKKQMQDERRSSPRSPESKPRSIPIRSPSPSVSPTSKSPNHPSQKPSFLPTPFTDAHHKAALKIQTAYRIHRSLRTIQDLHGQFTRLKADFVHPSHLDFARGAETIVSVDTTLMVCPSGTLHEDLRPKLAYTHNNATLHTYVEHLNRLLVKLDEIQSFGSHKVREQRKAVVRQVEQEAADVENWWRSVWERACEQTSRKEMGPADETSTILVPTPDETDRRAPSTDEEAPSPMIVDSSPDVRPEPVSYSDKACQTGEEDTMMMVEDMTPCPAQASASQDQNEEPSSLLTTSASPSTPPTLIKRSLTQTTDSVSLFQPPSESPVTTQQPRRPMTPDLIADRHTTHISSPSSSNFDLRIEVEESPDSELLTPLDTHAELDSDAPFVMVEPPMPGLVSRIDLDSDGDKHGRR